jgi:hypothetical protein
MKTLLSFMLLISALALPLMAADIKQDGLTPGTAVVILASSEKEGAPKEIEWIQAYYPRSEVLRSVTRPSKNNKTYDVFFIKTADGKKVQLYFEISSFYHKT